MPMPNIVFSNIWEKQFVRGSRMLLRPSRTFLDGSWVIPSKSKQSNKLSTSWKSENLFLPNHGKVNKCLKMICLSTKWLFAIGCISVYYVERWSGEISISVLELFWSKTDYYAWIKGIFIVHPPPTPPCPSITSGVTHTLPPFLSLGCTRLWW